MADNTTLNAGTGGDVIATDDITTLNGGATSGFKAQRVKVGWGVDGTFTDVTGTSGLPIQGLAAASTTVSWTSATAVNTASSISIAGMNAVSVTLIPTTTFTAGVLTFEVSPDNTNWVPIAMARIDSYTSESSYTIAAGINRGWTTSVDGFNNFRVRLSTAITGTGTATIIIIPQAFAIEPMVTVGQATAGNLQTTIGAALPTGTNQIGNVGHIARTSGGASMFTLVSAATTNSTNIKSSFGEVYGIQASNTGASPAFLKFYNLTTAPTVGTSTVVKTLIIPAGGGIVVAANDIGIAFSTGIGIGITGAAASTDTTAVAAAQVVVNVDYF